MLFNSRHMVRTRIRLSVWFVSGYATFRCHCHSPYFTQYGCLTHLVRAVLPSVKKTHLYNTVNTHI